MAIHLRMLGHRSRRLAPTASLPSPRLSRLASLAFVLQRPSQRLRFAQRPSVLFVRVLVCIAVCATVCGTHCSHTATFRACPPAVRRWSWRATPTPSRCANSAMQICSGRSLGSVRARRTSRMRSTQSCPTTLSTASPTSMVDAARLMLPSWRSLTDARAGGRRRCVVCAEWTRRRPRRTTMSAGCTASATCRDGPSASRRAPPFPCSASPLSSFVAVPAASQFLPTHATAPPQEQDAYDASTGSTSYTVVTDRQRMRQSFGRSARQNGAVPRDAGDSLRSQRSPPAKLGRGATLSTTELRRQTSLRRPDVMSRSAAMPRISSVNSIDHDLSRAAASLNSGRI